MKNKRISIIVPVYNAEKWLEMCINSVLNQTYKNVELILVDDGSVDNSSIICKKFVKEYDNIKYFYKKNEGPSAARNFGIGKATGDYIEFLDSDDYLSDDCCEKLINAMEINSADFVLCGLKVWKNDVLLRTPHLQNKCFKVQDSIKNFEYLYPIFASPCNKLFKKELIDFNFKDKQDLGEDLMFNLEYLKRTDKVVTISDCLYNVRLDNDNSLNRKFREDRMDILLSLKDKEKEVCRSIYGDDIAFIYNQYILCCHYYFKEIILTSTKKQCISIYKKYLLDVRIEEAINKCNFDNTYYRIFNLLLKKKLYTLIYYFLRLRQKIDNLRK